MNQYKVPGHMNLIHYILLISGIHTATGPKHGTHHWYPDLDYMRTTYGEGTKVNFIECIQRHKFQYMVKFQSLEYI